MSSGGTELPRLDQGNVYVWSTSLLQWVRWDGSLTVGGVTIGNVNQGTGGASAWKVDGSSFPQPVTGTFYQATQPVSIATMPTTPVTGTFWQATQPVSAASLPLPSGAATDAATVVVSAGIGSPSVDGPAYGTVLDLLARVKSAVTEGTTKMTEAIASAAQPVQAAKRYTLLHRGMA